MEYEPVLLFAFIDFLNKVNLKNNAILCANIFLKLKSKYNPTSGKIFNANTITFDSMINKINYLRSLKKNIVQGAYNRYLECNQLENLYIFFLLYSDSYYIENNDDLYDKLLELHENTLNKINGHKYFDFLNG